MTITTTSDKAFEIFKSIQSGNTFEYKSPVDPNKVWLIRSVGNGYYEFSHNKSNRSKRIPGRQVLRSLTMILDHTTPALNKKR